MSQLKFTTFGEIAQFINGFAFKPEDWEANGVPIIRIQNLTDASKSFNYTTKIIPNQYIVKPGELLVSWSATLDVYEWTNHYEALLNQHIFKVVPDLTKVYQPYLKYAIKQAIDLMSKYTHGSTMKHINRSEFLSTKIPLLPLEEQKRIATILDKAEAVRRMRQETIRLLDEFLRSVFLEMFGDPVRNEKGWEVVPLGQFINFITSGSRGWARYYSNAGEKFIRIQNVTKGRLLFDSVQYVNAPETQEAKRTRVRKGDLLISITADLGRTAVVDEKTATEGAYINQHLCLLRLNESVNPIYISRFLESEGGRNQFKMLDQIGVKSGLNFDSIKSLKILNPPIDLQNKFVKIIKQTDKQRDILIKRSLSEMENGFDSMMKKAFWGEL
jgi:type I restriction enzyme S subunit